VNGRLVRQGKKSGEIVHPGLGEPFQRDEATYFQGDMNKPQLFLQALTHERIQQLAGAGLPAPEAPPAIEPVGNEKSDLLIWQNGRYALNDHKGRSHSVQISGIRQPVEIIGPWRVSFPPDLGAPSEVVLTKLISLHRHPEAGVRYFSGTAAYTNRFHLAAKARDRRVYLDLGRVQVLAEVRVNSRNLGILWKPPFRVDVTDAVHEGENHLEVLVTNLWPNRLIGDEHLSPENEYSASNGFFGGGIKKMPDWYLKGEPKPPGGRVTFTTWKHFDKDSALLESGLLGPVQLRSAALLAIGELK
jgi:hypothetical protein